MGVTDAEYRVSIKRRRLAQWTEAVA